jgi:hypothetical protein
MIVENKLAAWVVPIKDHQEQFRAFSHCASTPEEVHAWTPVDLDHLGQPVLFDNRTCELMKDHDVTFLMSTKHNTPVLHAVIIKPRGGAAPADPTTDPTPDPPSTDPNID